MLNFNHQQQKQNVANANVAAVRVDNKHANEYRFDDTSAFRLDPV